jgi:hypothetical protein
VYDVDPRQHKLEEQRPHVAPRTRSTASS